MAFRHTVTHAGKDTSHLGMAYRADWEPEAPKGKCMPGVPRVFWRPPVVFWGPSTPNPTWVLRKTHTSKKLADVPCVHVEMWWICPILPSTPFRDKVGPHVRESMPFGSPSHQGLKDCGFTKIFLLVPIIFIFGDFFAVFALLVMC